MCGKLKGKSISKTLASRTGGFLKRNIFLQVIPYVKHATLSIFMPKLDSKYEKKITKCSSSKQYIHVLQGKIVIVTSLWQWFMKMQSILFTELLRYFRMKSMQVFLEHRESLETRTLLKKLS